MLLDLFFDDLAFISGRADVDRSLSDKLFPSTQDIKSVSDDQQW